MARLRTVVLAAGAAVLVRRALRTRIRRSPLWPLPALEEPVSGRPRSRAAILRVVRRDTPADGVVRLRLEGTGELLAWEPGAHLDLVLPSGTVRQYSLCGDPADRSAYTVATRVIEVAEGGRGGSLELHRELREGTEVTVRGPRNRFRLTPAPAYLFVAGGIGITPLLPMVRAAQAAAPTGSFSTAAGPGPRCPSPTSWRSWAAPSGSPWPPRTRAASPTWRRHWPHP
ncbi:hypothetical protein ACFQVA_09610 [Actinomadura keratinilytica]